MGKIYHSHGSHKQAGVFVLIRKIGLEVKINHKRQGHWVLPKGNIYHQDITMLNIYDPRNGASTYLKQTHLIFKNQIDHKQ